MGFGMGSPTGYSQKLGSTGRGGWAGDRIPKGYRKSTVSQFTPEQMQLLGSLFGHVGPDSYLSKLAQGDEGLFNELEAPALKQFNALQGNIASRFSGGGLGGRHSSGFQNTMSQAASDFAQNLQSQRMGLQQHALEDLFKMSELLLGQRPYATGLTQKSRKPSFGQQLLGLVSPIAGDIAAGQMQYTPNFLKLLGGF